MKNITYKIVAWSTPEELHEECMDWVSQLEFLKFEQRFLNELITNYTIPLISAKGYDTSIPLIGNLLKEEKDLNILITRVQDHNNTFERLLKTNIDIREKEAYTETHYQIKTGVFKYTKDYRKTKLALFKKIKKITTKKHFKKISNL